MNGYYQKKHMRHIITETDDDAVNFNQAAGFESNISIVYVITANCHWAKPFSGKSSCLTRLSN